MKRKAQAPCAVLAAMGVATTACGGKAVVDGGGGGAQSGAKGTTIGATVSTGATTGSGAGHADCEVICNSYTSHGCKQPDCVNACAAAYSTAGNCLDELTTFDQCFAEHAAEAASCSFPPACVAAYAAYVACAGTPTGREPYPCTSVVQGTIAGGLCSSFTDCGGTVYSETCWGAVDELPTLYCECTVNGTLVGTCEEYDFGWCDVHAACCEFVIPWP